MSLPIYKIDHYPEFDQLKSFVLDFFSQMQKEFPEEMAQNQVALQTSKNSTDRFHSCVRLQYGYNEIDYDTLLPELVNSPIDLLLRYLKIPIYRLRIIRREPSSFYKIHVDGLPRVHLPILSHENCAMLFPTVDFMKSMNADGSVYIMNSKIPHTFVNWGQLPRLHLVATTSDDKI